MENNSTFKAALLPRIYCNIFGHDYHVTKKVTRHVKEYRCSHCKKELTTNGNGDLTALTPKFKEINEVLEKIHSVRNKRLQDKSITSSIRHQIV
ncbi:hypothetical protein PW52_11470 [Tamlana sedimentorum]|uniref:Uncharacterized protein n=1 Tax=Neotamlana sedimentorum TaxID=1435349 RepID=A0A0D7W8B3_9FLAO|nr:hypothetical protein [Tamlana sedimentorum]KJD35279.1 hypothetical protein PW52_11470 [Tamlana sedimentorum]